MTLRASVGTLGFLRGSTPPGMRTAYFMLDGKCVFDCAFCTHARNARADRRDLSRVVWREIDTETALEIVSKDTVKRVCLQAVSYPRYEKDLLNLIKLFSFKKVSASVRALTLREVDSYFEAGLDTIGMAIDAVTEKLFSTLRGGSLKRYMDLIERVANKYPKRVTTHVIVGLGETERDVVEMMDRLHSMGVRIALFAFTPMRGTKLENRQRPPLESYRRIQIARFLIENDLINANDVKFSENGEIVDFGVDLSRMDIKRAFLTSGCEDCTRPFYNERPGEELYNIHDETLLDHTFSIASFRTSTTNS